MQARRARTSKPMDDLRHDARIDPIRTSVFKAIGLATRLTVTAAACSLTALHAQAQGAWQLQNHFQVGVDAWHIEHSSEVPATRGQMFLADSETAWSYRDVSPWYTAQSQLSLGPLNQVVLRARASQGSGGVLDQLYYDHGISPSLGFRVGVADYRATWCREYDLDNPWIKEGDPFCSQRLARKPLSSAPALQVYLNTEVGPYQFQGIAGVFRPKALGYAPREFSGAIVPEHVQITHNHKQSLSFNALNKLTSTEWRWSWVRIDQRSLDTQYPARATSGGAVTTLDYHQQADTVFAGVSWQINPRWRARLTHMVSLLRAHCNLPDPLPNDGCVRVRRRSTVLEWNYHAAATDMVSIALIDFPFRQDNVYERRHQSLTTGWRRDWGQGWFGSVQLSRSRTVIPYTREFRELFPPGTASAWALGTRLGYAF